jgi:hypothetical protein
LGISNEKIEKFGEDVSISVQNQKSLAEQLI